MKFVFFGTPIEAVYALDALLTHGQAPTLIVTAPDRPAGRHMTLTPPAVKTWALEHSIPLLQPEKLDADFLAQLRNIQADLFIVTAYGKILKDELLAIPPHCTLNIHPSLLPKYRGPTPIESALLAGDTETGVTIMQIDAEVDHGPIYLQETIAIEETDDNITLGKKLFTRGGELLADLMQEFADEKIPTSRDQDHALATFTKKIKKEDGELFPTDTDEIKWRKYRAYQPWPGVFFFLGRPKSDEGGENGKRVKVTSAKYENNTFVIERVVPEGKKEMDYRKGFN